MELADALQEVVDAAKQPRKHPHGKTQVPLSGDAAHLGNGWARVVDASPGDGLPLGVGELRSALRAVAAIRARLPLLQHQPGVGSLGADCFDVSEIRQAASVRRQASCHRGVVPVISWEPGNATRRQSSERIDRTLVHSGQP